MTACHVTETPALTTRPSEKIYPAKQGIRLLPCVLFARQSTVWSGITRLYYIFLSLVTVISEKLSSAHLCYWVQYSYFDRERAGNFSCLNNTYPHLPLRFLQCTKAVLYIIHLLFHFPGVDPRLSSCLILLRRFNNPWHTSTHLD